MKAPPARQPTATAGCLPPTHLHDDGVHAQRVHAPQRREQLLPHVVRAQHVAHVELDHLHALAHQPPPAAAADTYTAIAAAAWDRGTPACCQAASIPALSVISAPAARMAHRTTSGLERQHCSTSGGCGASRGCGAEGLLLRGGGQDEAWLEVDSQGGAQHTQPGTLCRRGHGLGGALRAPFCLRPELLRLLRLLLLLPWVACNAAAPLLLLRLLLPPGKCQPRGLCAHQLHDMLSCSLPKVSLRPCPAAHVQECDLRRHKDIAMNGHFLRFAEPPFHQRAH